MSFNPVQVRHIGTRVQPMKVQVIVDGKRYGPGYTFAAGMVQTVYECEADVLTGKTKPVISDDGTIQTGFVVLADLGEKGLTGEAYEVYSPPQSEQEPQAEPAKPKARKPEPVVTEPVTEPARASQAQGAQT